MVSGRPEVSAEGRILRLVLTFTTTPLRTDAGSVGAGSVGVGSVGVGSVGVGSVGRRLGRRGLLGGQRFAIVAYDVKIRILCPARPFDC